MSALIFMAVTARTPLARAIALGLSVLAYRILYCGCAGLRRTGPANNI